MSASEEVDTATGEAPAQENVIELLTEKRRALNEARDRYAIAKAMRDETELSETSRLIDALKTIITELESEASIVIEATGRKEAEHRLKKIKSAAGGLRTELKADDAKVRNAENELSKANATRTEHARQYESYQTECNALSDRFDLPRVRLEVVDEPPRIDAPRPWQYQTTRPSFEFCEHNRRQRRDYAEIAGTSGYAIIQTAGLKPFRPLTEREREVLEDAKEQKPDPVLAAAAVEANALGNLGVPGGHVQRG